MMSPLILSFPFREPMSAAQSEVAGRSRATGLPCLVIIRPSGVRLSRMAKHSCLNFEAFTFSMSRFYDMDRFFVHFSRRGISGKYARHAKTSLLASLRDAFLPRLRRP